ncbi:SAM-dependent methyltransferase [Nonomuraea wenchangensis]
MSAVLAATDADMPAVRRIARRFGLLTGWPRGADFLDAERAFGTLLIARAPGEDAAGFGGTLRRADLTHLGDLFVLPDRQSGGVGRALLAVDDTTTVVEADLLDPEAILHNPEVRRLIDFDRPVALLLLGILHHLADHEDPGGITRRLMDRLVPGSYLAVSHFHNPGPELPEVSRQAYSAEKVFNETMGTGRWRTRAEILAYFDGLDLLEPGLVPLPEWRPGEDDHAMPGITYHTFVGGVARKPEL